MFIFYSVHYPYPDKEDLLVESMHQYGELMRQQPGLVFIAPYPFKDAEKGTLMGVSIWENQEAFEAAIPALRANQRNAPADNWERQPTETYTLNSAK